MKGKRHESRIDHTDRELERAIKEGRILFPAVPRAADCTEMSERVEGYAGTEGCEGEVCGDMGPEVCAGS